MPSLPQDVLFFYGTPSAGLSTVSSIIVPAYNSSDIVFYLQLSNPASQPELLVQGGTGHATLMSTTCQSCGFYPLCPR